jgi:glucose dehydrogenase
MLMRRRFAAAAACAAIGVALAASDSLAQRAPDLRKSGINQNINTVCCGWSNRGLTIGEGKVILGSLDGSFAALDMKTGKTLWKTQVGRWQDGYTIASVPVYHGDVIYTGISGGDRSTRGFLAALDAKTGKENWRFWTVLAPGEFGSESWPKPDDPDPKRANAWKVGGASVWLTPAIDPDLGLIYFLTGNPGPEAGGMGRDRPGDNLFSASIVAITLAGKYAWHFQQVHHDLWHFDCPSPVVLFDQIDDFTYGPFRTTVTTGTKVTFTNAGTQAHNATSSEGGGWDTGMPANGESASVTFNQPGTYTYVCSPHPSMIGQILVTGPAIAAGLATVVESNAPKSTGPTPPHGAH